MDLELVWTYLAKNLIWEQVSMDCVPRKRNCLLGVRDPPEPMRHNLIRDLPKWRPAQPGRQLRREHHHRPVRPTRPRSLGSGKIKRFICLNIFSCSLKRVNLSFSQGTLVSIFTCLGSFRFFCFSSDICTDNLIGWTTLRPEMLCSRLLRCIVPDWMPLTSGRDTGGYYNYQFNHLKSVPEQVHPFW